MHGRESESEHYLMSERDCWMFVCRDQQQSIGSSGLDQERGIQSNQLSPLVLPPHTFSLHRAIASPPRSMVTGGGAVTVTLRLHVRKLTEDLVLL